MQPVNVEEAQPVRCQIAISAAFVRSNLFIGAV